MYGHQTPRCLFAIVQRSNGVPPLAGAKADPRKDCVAREVVRRHGPDHAPRNAMDIGELTKPFIFLDYAEVAPGPRPFFVSADTPTPRPDGRVEVMPAPRRRAAARVPKLCLALSPRMRDPKRRTSTSRRREVEEVRTGGSSSTVGADRAAAHQ